MTQATLARPHAPKRSYNGLSTVILVAVACLASYAMTLALRDPDVVPRLTVDNPGTVPINVDVRANPGGGRLILDTVSAGTHATTLDVLDQGDRWTFSFSAAGVDGGSVTVSREQLAANHWRLMIPDEVIARIRAGTFVPAYR